MFEVHAVFMRESCTCYYFQLCEDLFNKMNDFANEDTTFSVEVCTLTLN